MNEYTELIAELRDGADFQDAIDRGRIREAADATDQFDQGFNAGADSVYAAMRERARQVREGEA